MYDVADGAENISCGQQMSGVQNVSGAIKSGARKIMDVGVRLVLVTLGSEGVYYLTRDKNGDIIEGKLGVPEVHVVDTTCAGDSFTGGLLYRLTRSENPLLYTKEELEEHLAFANAVASICVTRRGALPALPSMSETEEFIKNHI